MDELKLNDKVDLDYIHGHGHGKIVGIYGVFATVIHPCSSKPFVIELSRLKKIELVAFPSSFDALTKMVTETNKLAGEAISNLKQITKNREIGDPESKIIAVVLKDIRAAGPIFVAIKQLLK